MIPLRLIFGETEKHVVQVDATDINIVTERTVAAFPVPVSSYRAAIDTNIPQVIVSIQGIIQDDPGIGITFGSPSSLSIDFSNIYPTETPPLTPQNNALQNNLQGAEIVLKPAYWKYNSPIHFFSGNYLVLALTSDVPASAGGSTAPSVSASANLAERHARVKVNVPVGGILYNSTNNNPASTLAAIIKDALELTTEITQVGAVNGAGKRGADAFNVSQTGTTLSLVDTYTVPNAPHTPTLAMRDSSLKRVIVPAKKHTSRGSSLNALSAGDKAQNLLGMLANSTKDDDLLRGIQIPYNSLITSDDITPVVRNFFLTSGKVSPVQKGSIRNIRPSTQPMDIGTVTLSECGIEQEMAFLAA